MNEFVGILLLILSVLIGGAIVVFLEKANRQSIIKLLLALSGGFLIAITFLHFIPEIYIHNGESIGYYILIGFLLQLFLEYFSKGIEHGHIHTHAKIGAIPWGLFISLSIHSFIEGIPIEAQFHSHPVSESLVDLSEALSHGHHHHHHGEGGIRGLLLGVILHNIPVGIALMTLMLTSGFSKVKAWTLLSIFALMGPLGVLFGHISSGKMLFDMNIVLAIVVGMFLHISTTIIFESAENHKFNVIKLVSMIIGVLLAIATLQV